jgi:hypothetical protein
MAKVKRTITNVPFAQHLFIVVYAPEAGEIGTIKFWIKFIEPRSFTLRTLINGVSVKSEEVESVSGNETLTVDSEVNTEVAENDRIAFQLYQPDSIGDYLDQLSLYFEVI